MYIYTYLSLSLPWTANIYTLISLLQKDISYARQTAILNTLAHVRKSLKAAAAVLSTNFPAEDRGSTGESQALRMGQESTYPPPPESNVE